RDHLVIVKKLGTRLRLFEALFDFFCAWSAETSQRFESALYRLDCIHQGLHLATFSNPAPAQQECAREVPSFRKGNPCNPRRFKGSPTIGARSMSASEKTKPNRVHRVFSKAANIIAWEAGKPAAFITALGVVAIWAVTGPMFRYSDTWQLVINTGTTIVTFLMVFLIQNSQNRDSAAIQVKLDELIRVSAAKNFFVGIEHLTDDEIDRLREVVESRSKSSVKKVNQKADEAAARVS